MDNQTTPTHRDIINLWPSFRAFVADTGAPYLVVHKWPTRNSIPSKYWVRIVNAAHDRDLPVTYKLLAECCAIRDAVDTQTPDKKKGNQ